MASFWSASEFKWLTRSSSLRPRRACTSRLCFSNISSAWSRLSSCRSASVEVVGASWLPADTFRDRAADVGAFINCAEWRRHDASSRRSSRSDGEKDMYHGTTGDADTQTTSFTMICTYMSNPNSPVHSPPERLIYRSNFCWKFCWRHQFWCHGGDSEVFPSVPRHCWLGDRKGIRPAKGWVSVCLW